MDQFEDPRWLRALVFVPAALFASFGAAGLFLAAISRYSLPSASVLGAVVFAVMCLCARPLVPNQGTTSEAANICAVVAVVAILGITAWNVSNAAQHVLVVRDGGTYLNAGKWLAEHHTLRVGPAVGPFAHNAAVTSTSAGLSISGDHLNFSLAHLVPVVLAEAQGIGGDGFMFAVVPILGGVSLLAFYALARRVLRHPIAALGAMLCLAFLMPQVSFSRDSMSEIPVQVLLFTAVWLLCDSRVVRYRRTAFVAGLFLGLVQATHIDGLAFLVGLPFVGLITWLRADRERRRQVGRSIFGCALGVAVGVGLGFLDLSRLGPGYLRVRRSNVLSLVAVVVVALVVAVVLAFGLRNRPAEDRSRRVGFERWRSSAAFFAASVVLIGGAVAWFARPYLETTHGRANTLVANLQRRDALDVDATRRYFEHAVQWVSWYVGPITLTLAIVGAALATRAFVRGELQIPSQVVALMLGPAALLYLWWPSVAPDQVWASRRFLPAVFPIVIIAAFAVLTRLADSDHLGSPELRRLGALALGVAAVAFPLHTILNIAQMTDEHGFAHVVDDVCRTVGPAAAVIIPQERDGGIWIYGPQTIRSFCGVPVGVMYSGVGSRLVPVNARGKLSGRVLRRLAADWAAEGRALYIVANAKPTITTLFPAVLVVSTRNENNPHFLFPSLTGRPSEYHSDALQLSIARVPLPQQ